MRRFALACICVAVVHAATTRGGAQSVYPTGTTIYDPDRAWNGYTVLSPLQTPAVLVIDMNGTVVKRWDGYNNSAGGPARVLPGGDVDIGKRRESAASGSAGADSARLRRQRAVALLAQRADHHA